MDEFSRRIAAIGATLPPETLAALQAAHTTQDRFGYDQCAAHGEQQPCCLDWLLEAVNERAATDPHDGLDGGDCDV